MPLQPEFLTFPPYLGEVAPEISPTVRKDAADAFKDGITGFLASNAAAATVIKTPGNTQNEATALAHYFTIGKEARVAAVEPYRHLAFYINTAMFPDVWESRYQLMVTEIAYNTDRLTVVAGRLYNNMRWLRGLGYTYLPHSDEVIRHEAKDEAEMQNGPWRYQSFPEYADEQIGVSVNSIDDALEAYETMIINQQSRRNDFPVGVTEIHRIMGLLGRATAS